MFADKFNNNFKDGNMSVLKLPTRCENMVSTPAFSTSLIYFGRQIIHFTYLSVSVVRSIIKYWFTSLFLTLFSPHLHKNEMLACCVHWSWRKVWNTSAQFGWRAKTKRKTNAFYRVVRTYSHFLLMRHKTHNKQSLIVNKYLQMPTGKTVNMVEGKSFSAGECAQHSGIRSFMAGLYLRNATFSIFTSVRPHSPLPVSLHLNILRHEMEMWGLWGDREEDKVLQGQRLTWGERQTVWVYEGSYSKLKFQNANTSKWEESKLESRQMNITLWNVKLKHGLNVPVCSKSTFPAGTENT